ncbi:MAG: hypothetical protein DHS20C17_07400 [Cyclobacteriaceae bacterium]|nr:MAG: hypothetical protein DHS20C17_07400 [Cyclobacteriaceae bacterium]
MCATIDFNHFQAAYNNTKLRSQQLIVILSHFKNRTKDGKGAEIVKNKHQIKPKMY